MHQCLKRFAVLVLLAASSTVGAQVQEYPNRPIRLVLPLNAGSGVEGIARFVAKAMSDKLGERIVVDNRPGASGMVAMREFVRSAPDGYTIAYANITVAISQSLIGNGQFNLKRDAVPIGGMATGTNVLASSPSLPAKSVNELVTLLKAKPGGYSYASGGNGTPAHLNGEIFKQAAGVDVLHVPYKALGPAITDISRGDVDFMFGDTSSMLPGIRSGRLRALAVTSDKRLAVLPDVPTMTEAGFSANVTRSWSGLIAPVGTPASVITRLSEVLKQVLADPETTAFMQAIGNAPAPSSPEEFGRLMASETDRWQKFIQDNKLKAD